MNKLKDINLNNKKSEKLLIDELKSQLRKVIFNRCNKKPFMNKNKQDTV